MSSPQFSSLYQSGADRPRDMLWVTPEVIRLPQFEEYTRRFPDFTFQNWGNSTVKQHNLAALEQVSSLACEVIANKQGWLFPEKLYVGDPAFFEKAQKHNDSLDRYVMRQPMCHSLLTRFHFVSGVLLPHYIRECLAKKGSVTIASFGSGTGRDVIEAMTHFGDEEVTAHLFDIDPRCLDVGRKLARGKNLQSKVVFVQDDLTRIQDCNFDIGLLVGVICPVADRYASIAMKRVKRHIEPEHGVLITSSSSEKMETDDPFSRFMIEYSADWFLKFRSAEVMKRLCEGAGYTTVSLDVEPTGFHRFVIGTPK